MKYILSLLLVFTVSCTSLGQMVKRLAGDDSASTKTQSTSPKKVENSYANNKNFSVGMVPKRKYGRMNRDRFEQEAKVQAGAGSLWVEEGQSSYLFSQNQKRLEGDVLNIMLENQAKDQLNNKIGTIAGLLKQRRLAVEKRKAAQQKRQVASTDKTQEKKEEPKPEAKTDNKSGDKIAGPQLKTDKIPSRVIATYPDGSYRVKGTKTMLIENKEFQVMVTGLVRGNDIKDDAIASGKLLDAKFDIVSNRRVR